MKRVTQKTFISGIALGLMLFLGGNISLVSAAVMTSSSYAIQNDSVNFGGGQGSSASYGTESSFGESGTGNSSSASYNNNAGYQQGSTASPSDITAPSIPIGLTATAVATSQIDLSWTASTDDTAVTGYKVYRDSVYITTSAGITYSDTGLSADTLYSYTVSAIDAASNESSQSSSASATTFATASSGGGGGSSGGYATLSIQYLNVSPSTQTALIQFGTNIPTKATVYWGTTNAYELGSLTSVLYLDDHSVPLPDLVAGTHYFFKIIAVDGHGRTLSIDNQEFTTLSSSNSVPSTNISDFHSGSNQGSITLTWKNPKIDFGSVVIVRSTTFYPNSPSDGVIVYRGSGEQYIDQDVVSGKTYYYTAFSVDATGEYSSGVVTDGKLLLPGEEPVLSKLFGGIVQLSKELIDPLLRNFSIGGLSFFQDGERLPIAATVVQIRGDRDLVISIDYDKMPEILKTIAVTVHDPEDETKTFSFLLRVNADKTAYQAHIAAFGRPGEYPFNVVILDHQHQGLVSVDGTMVSKMPDGFLEEGQSPTDSSWSTKVRVSMIAFFALIVACLVGWFVKKKIASAPLQ